MGHIVGVDIGGTFTDGVLVADAGGQIATKKVATTPPDFEQGFVAVLDQLARDRGTDLRTLLGETDAILHGCTVGTNALVVGATSEVALLTTRGHRDSIFTMRAGRRLHNSTPSEIAHVAGHEKPEPLVPRTMVVEIDERVDSDGDVVVELNEERAAAEIERLLGEGVRSFAISLLWSIANDAHERRLAAMIREREPEAFVSTSSSVATRAGEYERTVGAVINSLVGPTMVSYLNRLQSELQGNGFRGQLNIMSCAGGLMDLEEATAYPVYTIGSGPAAGVVASATLARETAGAADGPASLVTMDIGGTTTDVALVQAGSPQMSASSWHGQFEYFVPTVNVRSIGAGGGSIIRFDEDSRTIKVGPQSAGADPGPVAYGRGGSEPTIADANVVLGFLDPDNFLGGSMKLDAEAARAALARVGEPLGFDAVETAAAAIRIVNDQMADALRLVSVETGVDPRGFAVAAYGGGGPLHASAVARRLGMSRVVVPLGDLAATWSAFGVATSEGLVVREDAQLMHDPFDLAAINATWERLEAEAVERLRSERVPAERIECERAVEMRYRMQVNQIPVAAPGGSWEEADLTRLIADFEREYERIYGQGTGYAKAGCSIAAMRVVARAPRQAIGLGGHAGGEERRSEPSASRTVHSYQGGQAVAREMAVHDGREWGPGVRAEGPAIVEFPDTTLVLGDGDTAEVDGNGNVVVAVAGGDAAGGAAGESELAVSG